jgi:mannopine transport system substrate-binding protein
MKYFCLAVLSLTLLSPAQAQDRQVVIATTGGTYEQQMREFIYEPFTRETGIRVVPVSGSGADQIARVQAMVASGRATWDIFFSGEIQAASEKHKALTEDLAGFCAPFLSRADLLPGACNETGVLAAYGTTLIVYNTERYAKGGPADWKEFWDVGRFPGPRAFPNFNDPWRVMAAALMADGVAPKDVFPIDVERALRKLDQIRPHVGLWWRTGDQSTQGFRSGEYTLGLIWQTRAMTMRNEGQQIGWTQNQAFLVGDRMSLVRGAPNRDNALRFLAYYLNAIDGQAKRCEVATCTPPSRDAIARMPAAIQEMLPTSEAAMRQLVLPDAAWINANQERLLTRWNAWIAN